MQLVESKPLITGRPLGKANLSDDVKIEILTKKKLQQVSQMAIAEEFGVARKTVNQLSEDDLSPEGKQKLVSFVKELAKARDKVITRINEKLDKDTFKDNVYPNLLQAVNTNYRLETNQSTVNVQSHSFVEVLVKWAKAHNALPEQIEEKIVAIADANGQNAAEMRVAVQAALDA